MIYQQSSQGTKFVHDMTTFQAFFNLFFVLYFTGYLRTVVVDELAWMKTYFQIKFDLQRPVSSAYDYQ